MTDKNIINIHGTDINIKEYRGQRVVTFKDIDAVHGRPEGTALRNFNTNRNRFVENEDYFIVGSDEIRRNGLFPLSDNDHRDKALITEQGYLMLVKSFTDDLAWEVQRSLVNGYFKVKTLATDLSPQMQMLYGMLDQMAQTERQAREAKEIAQKAVETTEAIKEAIQPVFDDWREETNKKFNRIQKSSGKQFSLLRNEMYEALEQRAGCDLGTRLRNLQSRMTDKGCTKTEISKVTKMDVIESDKRLREIFSKIVTEYEVRFCA